MNPLPLRLLVIEDDELFRLGLSVRLQQEPDLKVVGEASDGQTGVEFASHTPLDVVLLDIGLPGMGGVETCHQIKQKLPQLPILILTSHSQASLIARLITAGANGYCLKGCPTETLILALRSVAAGASWWDPVATAQIHHAFQEDLPDRDPLTNPSDLTKREQEILSLIAAGKSNQDIATLLYISTGTVRAHVHAILHKLGVRDRTQAAVIALKNHWIRDPRFGSGDRACKKAGL